MHSMENIPNTLEFGGSPDLISLSSATLESILPIQFEDKALKKNYTNTLYPSREAKKAGTVTRKTYPSAFNYLGQVSAVVNAVLAQARFIYLDIPNLAASGLSMEALQTHLDRNLSIIQEDFNPKTVSDSVKVPMGAISSGRSHIIKDSTRYKGGKDILMSGVPNGHYGGTTTVWSTVSGEKNRLPDLQMQLPAVVVGSRFQDLSYQLAEAVNRWLYDSPNTAVVGHPGERTITQLRIRKGMWDVSELGKVLDNIMVKAGFRRGFGKITLDAVWPTGLEQSLGEFFSFIVVKEPDHKYLATIAKHPGITESEHPEAEALPILQPEYGMSMAMNLPEEVVAYITQTPKGKKVPLVSLNTWFNAWARAVIKAPRTKLNRGSGDRITVANTPRYVLLPSEAPAVAKRRKELGLFAEQGRINDDNMFISNTGRFQFCPPADDVIVENAKNYEKIQEETLEVSFAAGAPLIASQSGYASPYFATKDEQYRNKVKALKASLGRYAGALQTYSWDYNCILTSSRSDPERLISIPLTGASKPDSLAVSEYLTMPASAAVLRMFPGISDEKTDTKLDDFALRSSGGLLGSSLFASVAKAYGYLLFSGKVPALQTLIDRAAKALDITSVDPAKVTETGPERYEIRLYSSDSIYPGDAVIDFGLKLLPAYTFRPVPQNFKYDPNDAQSDSQYKTAVADIEKQISGAYAMLRSAMRDAMGGARSNIMRINVAEGTPIDDDPHYFDMAVHNLGEFSNLYNYLGGRVFFEMITALSKADIKDMSVVDAGNPLPIPPFETIVKEVMPLVTFFGKYAPERDRIIEEGNAISEALKPDESVTLDNIHLPGSKDTFQVFPHQFKALQTLGRSAPPRFATLDIAPGGGKTLLGIIDIGNLIHSGKIKRPCILCPNGLVRNWIEDLHAVTEGRWNIIPLTTATYATWGEERLTKIIQKAPINTIFVVGLSFMKLRPYQVVIGNHVEKVSGTLEFCKKFGFDYVILDESHKAKNTRSMVHKSVKQMTVSSSVKYVRLATGTLLQTKLTDVVGQSALFGAHIFRTQEEYEEENSIPAGNGRASVFASDTPYRARKQLAKHCAVISFKKKEWAFMLPRPIETFLSVRLDAEGDELGQAHQMMYQAVLKATLEEIKKDENVAKLMKGKGEDADDSDDDDEGDSDDKLLEALSNPSKTPSGLPTTSSETLDDATLEELESALRPYLQRLEMMLTDPMGDPLASQFFKEMGRNDYVSNKVKKIIERIELNFKEFPWVKGSKYKLKALTDYNGVRYTLMGKKGEKLTLDSYKEEYVSIIPPDKDPRWKPEPFGKVIVFCRYTRSVNAIYRALPPHLKKLAVMFSGGVKDKWGNLESFRTTPYSTDKGVQILIANEQAISEGHNLQMASRIVRVESPWSPGELDQSSSRIFRPDTTGKFRRETVYLDWVVCNNCVVGSTLVATKERGIIRMDSVHDSWITRSPDITVGSRDKIQKPVEWRALGPGKTYKVKTDLGYEIQGTGQHRMLSIDVETCGTDWSRIDALQPGSYCVLSTEPVVRTSVLDLSEAYVGMVPQDPRQRVQYKLPKVMTPDLAFLMGCIDSEGHWQTLDQNEPGSCYFVNTDKAFVEKYVACVQNVFGVSLPITRTTSIEGRKPAWKVSILSKPFCRIMTALGMYTKPRKERGNKPSSYFKSVPWSILQADGTSQMAYIAAYIEGDGWVVNKPVEQTYGICSYSRKMRILLQQLLQSHGIISRITGNSVIISAPYSHQLHAKLEKHLLRKHISKENRCKRPRYDYGIPFEPLDAFLNSRFVRRKSFLKSVFLNDNGDEVETKASLFSGRKSEYLRYGTFDEGGYDDMLEQLKLVSPTAAKNLLGLFKRKHRYHFTRVEKVAYKGIRPVYDFSMGDAQEPAYVANGLVTHNTMEVAKLGRLISRMVDKAKFDEADNTLYDPLAELELYPISMSLETIAATPLLEDIREYIDAYATFVTIQSAEFEEMRQTRPSTMFDVPQTQMPKGSEIIENVPYLPGLKSVPDRHNYGLTKLTTFLEDSEAEDSAAINADLRKLVGMYAHTEFGNGMIVKIQRAKAGDSSKLTSVTVNLANGDTYSAHPSMIYLAENITKENVADFTPKVRWATEGDKKRAAREERVRERERKKIEKLMEKLERAAGREAKRERKRVEAEKAAVKAKKATTAGKAKAKRAAQPVEEEEEQEDVISVSLFPVIYNGYLAVDAEPGEDDERYMRKLGFKNFGSYAFCQVKDKISFDALLVWLDKKFYLRSETRNRLKRLADSFASGRGRKFAIEMAPIADFKNFYQISHKLSGKDKASGLPELKIYPVIINGSLFLNVDLSTNPAFRRYLGKAVPGTKNVKFEEADGLWIQFFKTRNEVIAWTKSIRRQGIEIENYDVFKDRVDELKEKLRFIQKLAKE